MESIKHVIYFVLLMAGTSLGCAIIERELNESRVRLESRTGDRRFLIG